MLCRNATCSPQVGGYRVLPNESKNRSTVRHEAAHSAVATDNAAQSRINRLPLSADLALTDVDTRTDLDRMREDPERWDGLS